MVWNGKWRRFVDIALIDMWEDGTYATLYKKWFGTTPAKAFEIPPYRWYGLEQK